ncbi:hypothetical protein QBC33DRAFT_550373 [Phialemonium atrogriseum]|uniref:Uncharacterized protein n=1 Tax=Phialemonium atrogriseum TaxID=1093897 RepID=A0AAJ0BRF0_9PEZI|nr:uncharacterized protein QBC33DRAFT_550373 [Phialemonium atrogriseum]KAK1763100.1 hypothetical protein QBC33DRAFT_550373 [Phialemonium atrogriseum]
MIRGRGRGRGSSRRTQQSAHPGHSDPANLSTPIQSAHHYPPPHSAPQRGRPRNPAPSHSFSPLSPSAVLSAPRSEGPARFPGLQQSFSLDSPGSAMASNGPALRRRSRLFAASFDGSADEEPLSKGGHSLRKRARVDYTQEQIEDDLGSRDSKPDPAGKLASAPGARVRKRRATYDFSGDDSDEIDSAAHKRRRGERSPVGQRTTLVRRRNSTRKSMGDIRDYLDQPSDNEVQDTILVGVSMNELQSSPPQSDQQSESRRSASSDRDVGQIQTGSPAPKLQENKSSSQVVPSSPGREKSNPPGPSLETEEVPEVPSFPHLHLTKVEDTEPIVHAAVEPIVSNNTVPNNSHVESPEQGIQGTAETTIVEDIIVLPDQPTPEPSTPTASFDISTQEISTSSATPVDQKKYPSLLQEIPTSSATPFDKKQPPSSPSEAVTVQEEPASLRPSTTQEALRGIAPPPTQEEPEISAPPQYPTTQEESEEFAPFPPAPTEEEPAPPPSSTTPVPQEELAPPSSPTTPSSTASALEEEPATPRSPSTRGEPAEFATLSPSPTQEEPEELAPFSPSHTQEEPEELALLSPSLTQEELAPLSPSPTHEEPAPPPSSTILVTQEEPSSPVPTITHEMPASPSTPVMQEVPDGLATSLIQEKLGSPEKAPLVEENRTSLEATMIQDKPASPVAPPAEEEPLSTVIDVAQALPALPSVDMEIKDLPDGEYKSGSTATSAAESLQPQRPQPRKLKQLDSIYQEHGQTDSGNRFSPYEDGEVAYPSPWTEVVDDQQPEPTPALTPAPALPEQELSPMEQMWDGLRPLKYKEFFDIYRAEMASRKTKGQRTMTLQEFRFVCSIRRQDTLEAPPKRAPPKKGKKSQRRTAGSSRYRRKAQTQAATEAELAAQTPDDTPQASPAPDSEQITPARSPELLDGDGEAEQNETQQDIEEDGQDVEEAEDEAENEAEMEGPAGPREVLQYPKKQYSFRKIREATDFADALKDVQDMETSALQDTLATCTETLKTWQDEYLELKKITDDEENAKRRQANDKTLENWENRQKLDERPSWRRTFDDPFQKLPPAFELKGVRAPPPYVDDPVLEYQRAQDRVQANAHGFVHNNQDRNVGKQRPEEQRYETEDMENETRLRERKQTQKAADAAEESVIIEGKRNRKPRILDNQSQQPSRASTPEPAAAAAHATATRPRRKRNAAATAELANGESAIEQAAELAPKKRGRGKGKAKATPDESAVATPETPAAIQAEERIAVEKSKATRKRGRATASTEPHAANNVEEEPEPPKPKRQRTAKGRSAPSLSTDIPPRSFYSNPSPADTQPESRPSTSSSATTVDTVGTADSSYSLRENRKRNYAVDNDPDFEARPKKRTRGVTNKDAQMGAPPPPKRDRRRKMAPAEGAAPVAVPAFLPPGPANIAAGPGPMMSTFSATPPPAPLAPVAKRPPTKIKFVNSTQLLAASQGLSGAGTQAPSTIKTAAKAPKAAADSAPSESGASTQTATNGTAEPGEKPYSEMSKSEKMSYSMRRRWARGEMQGAVEKRKHTLALKAEAKSSTEPTEAQQKKPAKTGKHKAAASAKSHSGTASPAGTTPGTPIISENGNLPPPPPPSQTPVA